MSTPNHDTELEEILRKQATIRKGSIRFTGDLIEGVRMKSQDIVEIGIEDLMESLHTYLYKETLELIENAPIVSIAGGSNFRSERIDKAQLRKAAAERWGQE